MGRGDTLLNAVIGAAVTVFGSFIPFSPVLGGAIAGYLQREDSSSALRVGAISGLLAAIPFVLFVVFIGSFIPFLSFGMAGGPMGGVPGFTAGFTIVAILFAFVFGLVYTVGLSALGGYIGWYLESESDL